MQLWLWGLPATWRHIVMGGPTLSASTLGSPVVWCLKFNILWTTLVDTDLRMSTSETTTSISDTDSGSGGDDDHAPAVIDLTYERLQSLHAHGTIPRKELGDYAKRGVSSSRIKAAVNKPCCTCMCKLPVMILYKLCIAFWTLTKSSQDALLWSIQHESGNQEKKRWYMAGPLTHGQIIVHPFTLFETIPHKVKN